MNFPADYSITKFTQAPVKGNQKLQKDGGHGEGGCPLCDSSVYSYCDTKLFHDACCCNPYGNGIGSSYQCQYTDCSFIHANSCQEHQLIVTCCCYSPYRNLNSYQAAF